MDFTALLPYCLALNSLKGDDSGCYEETNENYFHVRERLMEGKGEQPGIQQKGGTVRLQQPEYY